MLLVCEWCTHMHVCTLVCVGVLLCMGKKLRLPVEVMYVSSLIALPYLLRQGLSMKPKAH